MFLRHKPRSVNSQPYNESFANTIPLLHPRGVLQVQDIFVERLNDYLHGFRGPGKMDGSIVKPC